jgi:methyl-accepting chemotaxis protein
VLGSAFARMTAHLRQMAGVAERIAGGDLTGAVQAQSERDVLGNAFARMTQSLREMVRELGAAASQLAAAATEILAATTQVASGASETATAISQTTTTVEEVKQIAYLANQKSQEVATAAQRSVEVAQSGTHAVDDAVGGMDRIRVQMETIAASIMRLSEQSQAIGDIITSVNDLAEQSNLLAVNAAIEAAKAGDQGKGFAVVAQEIKSLAEQSKQATAQVRTILNTIQKATNGAVMVTEEGNKAVAGGIQQSTQAGTVIRALAADNEAATTAAKQIAASSRQQLVGMDQMAQAIQSIHEASGQNLASTRQAEIAARNLHDLGQKLQDLVTQYQI